MTRNFGKKVLASAAAALISSAQIFAAPPVKTPADLNSILINALSAADQKRGVLNVPLNAPDYRNGRTITSWTEQINSKNIRVRELVQILSDGEYVSSENFATEAYCLPGYAGPLDKELGLLTSTLPFINFTNSEAEYLASFLAEKISVPYDSKSKDHSLTRRYSLIAASLVTNSYAGRVIFDKLMARLQNAESDYNPDALVWTARTLQRVPSFSPYQQRKLVSVLEPLLRNLGTNLKDELIDAKACREYKPATDPAIKMIDACSTNQQRTIKIFSAQVSSIAPFTGAEIISKDRYLFFQNDDPGTSGKNWAPTPNGHKHDMAFHLIWTLFAAYSQAGTPDKINDFIVFYARPNYSQNDFANYLQFSRYGLRIAADFYENETLEGWNEQYEIFINQMKKVLIKVAPGAFNLTAVQAGAEVMCGVKLLDTAFAALKAAGTAGGSTASAMMARLAPRLYYASAPAIGFAQKKVLAVTPLVLRQAVKILAAGGFMTALQKDNNDVHAYAPNGYGVKMSKEEVQKRLSVK